MYTQIGGMVNDSSKKSTWIIIISDSKLAKCMLMSRHNVHELCTQTRGK